MIAVVDPMTSQIGPDQFKEFVTPSIRAGLRLHPRAGRFEFVLRLRSRSAERCGDVRMQADNVSVDENIPLEFVRDVCLKHQVSFGGNIS